MLIAQEVHHKQGPLKSEQQLINGAWADFEAVNRD